MAFTVNDLQDLTRLLLERPEWLGEVRRIVLTDELLALPRELAEAQRRTDERFAELAEAQRRTDERLAELAEAQRRTEERLEQLIVRFEEAQRRNDDQFADIRGRLLEIEYRDKVGAIFGSRLRRPQVVDGGDLWEMLEARLDKAEIRQVVASDLVVRGRLPPQSGGSELWLAVEVSSVVDRYDVERAAQRAALLRKAGLAALGAVAGRRLTQGASALADELRVVISESGDLLGWDEALSGAAGE